MGSSDGIWSKLMRKTVTTGILVVLYSVKAAPAISVCGDCSSTTVTNGNFELDQVTTENGFQAGTPAGWTGTRLTLVKNNITAWGGEDSGDETNYLVMQGANAYVQQTVTNFTPGATYTLSWLAAERPNTDQIGNQTMSVYVLPDAEFVAADAAASIVNMNLTTTFERYSLLFVAERENYTLRFDNDSPPGDLSVFLDAVALCSCNSTETPTNSPTAVPTSTPTNGPTAVPTATPTGNPTATPTNSPTAVPTATPTSTPTGTTTTTTTILTSVTTSSTLTTMTGNPTATPTAPTNSPTATPTASSGTPPGRETFVLSTTTASPTETSNVASKCLIGHVLGSVKLDVRLTSVISTPNVLLTNLEQLLNSSAASACGDRVYEDTPCEYYQSEAEEKFKTIRELIQKYASPTVITRYTTGYAMHSVSDGKGGEVTTCVNLGEEFTNGSHIFNATHLLPHAEQGACTGSMNVLLRARARRQIFTSQSLEYPRALCIATPTDTVWRHRRFTDSRAVVTKGSGTIYSRLDLSQGQVESCPYECNVPDNCTNCNSDNMPCRNNAEQDQCAEFDDESRLLCPLNYTMCDTSCQRYTNTSLTIPHAEDMPTDNRICAFDDFFPGITSITNNLTILGHGTRIRGFSGIRYIGGNMTVYNDINDPLVLDGFYNLEVIAGSMRIGPSLIIISGFDALKTIHGDLLVKDTGAQEFHAFSGLTQIGGYLNITSNHFLHTVGDYDVFNRLETVGGIRIDQNPRLNSVVLNSISASGALLISSNAKLLNVGSFENLCHVDGDISIDNNQALSSLTGMHRVRTVTGNVDIINNTALMSLEGFNVQYIGGNLTIHGNGANFDHLLSGVCVAGFVHCTGCDAIAKCTRSVPIGCHNHRHHSDSILILPLTISAFSVLSLLYASWAL